MAKRAAQLLYGPVLVWDSINVSGYQDATYLICVNLTRQAMYKVKLSISKEGPSLFIQ